MAVSSTIARRSLPLLLSALLTSLIASALPRLAFRPGLPLPLVHDGQIAVETQDRLQAGMRTGRFSAIILFALVGLVLLAAFVLALRRFPLKRIFRIIWSVLWRLLFLAAVFAIVALFTKSSPPVAPIAAPIAPRPLEAAPPDHVPAFAIWLTAVLMAAAFAFLFLRAIRAKRAPVASWEQEIQRARHDLVEGGDLRETIIRCYAGMSEILKVERGLERGSAMTTLEFEAFLAAAGVPRGPVHELTRLFAQARYGRNEPRPGEDRGAIACLDAILEGARDAQTAGEA